MFIKKKMSLPDHSLKYIKKYQNIYRKVISATHQRENDRIIKRSVNKYKTLWQTIKKETANSHNEIENISLQTDSKLVIDPQVISQQFNNFFCK
jgi:hypothetical protein